MQKMNRLCLLCILSMFTVSADKQEPASGAAGVSQSEGSSARDPKMHEVQKTMSHVDATSSKKDVSHAKASYNERYLIDEMLVIIYTHEGSDFITLSELQRPSLDGASRTLDDLIFERLLYLDAKKYNMEPDEATIDKHLAQVQQQNSLTREEMLQAFASAGYDYEQGRCQLGMMFAINSIIDFKVHSRLIVPEREVKAYHNEHPIKLEPTYQIQRGLISNSNGMNIDEVKTRLKAIAEHPEYLSISWGDPVWIDESQLAEDKRFVRSMHPGGISEPQEKTDGIEVYKLVDKKPERNKPLEERYHEIANTLRQPKFKELMAEYKNELYTKASIVYMYPERDATNQHTQ